MPIEKELVCERKCDTVAVSCYRLSFVCPSKVHEEHCHSYRIEYRFRGTPSGTEEEKWNSVYIHVSGWTQSEEAFAKRIFNCLAQDTEK